MVCNKCGAENLDEAKFCSQCGTRLDGKKVCRFCNAEIKEDSVYCSNCGKRVDGKKICPNCGKLMEETERFCSQCGYSAIPQKSANPRTGANKATQKSVLFYVGNGLGLLALLFAFIGTFIIGFQTLGVDVTLIGSYSSAAITALPKSAKTLTLIFHILSILGVFAFLLTGTLMFAIKKRSVYKYMISGVAVFLMLVALILSLYCCNMNGAVSIRLTGATIAMTVLCFIIVTAVMCLQCVRAYMTDKKQLLTEIFKSATLLITCIAVVSFGYYVFKETVAGSSSGSLSVKCGVFAAFFDAQKEPLAIIGLICFLAGVAAITTSGILKAFNVNVSSVVVGFIALALQLAAIIFMFYGVYNELSKAASTYYIEIRAEYIIGMVITLIACGLNITHIVLKKSTAK